MESAASIEEVRARIRQAQEATSSAGHSAWDYVQAHEPALAEALGSLGLGIEEAGIWLITSGDNGSLSPFELVAAGRTKEVVENLDRAMHGFSA